MTAEGRTPRVSLIRDLAKTVASLRLAHPVRVAVDGRTASGKSTFADELAVALEQCGRSVIRASVDGFHHPAAVRYRQGRLSPDGYYDDARDLVAIRRYLLDPLGPGGSRQYGIASFDLERDEPLQPEMRHAAADAVLIVDGTFLQRPELRSAWDFVIFLDVPHDEAVRRGMERDGSVTASQVYEQRYAPAFARYEVECAPAEHADVVVDNTALHDPKLKRLNSSSRRTEGGN